MASAQRHQFRGGQGFPRSRPAVNLHCLTSAATRLRALQCSFQREMLSGRRLVFTQSVAVAQAVLSSFANLDET